jgi:hypothetical protein
MAWPGAVRHGGQGTASRGSAGRGEAWRSKQGLHGRYPREARLGVAVEVRQGWVRQRKARRSWRSRAGQGMAWCGVAVGAGLGMSRRGVTRLGMVRRSEQGPAGSGKAGRGGAR